VHFTHNAYNNRILSPQTKQIS